MQETLHGQGSQRWLEVTTLCLTVLICGTSPLVEMKSAPFYRGTGVNLTAARVSIAGQVRFTLAHNKLMISTVVTSPLSGARLRKALGLKEGTSGSISYTNQGGSLRLTVSQRKASPTVCDLVYCVATASNASGVLSSGDLDKYRIRYILLAENGGFDGTFPTPRTALEASLFTRSYPNGGVVVYPLGNFKLYLFPTGASMAQPSTKKWTLFWDGPPSEGEL